MIMNIRKTIGCFLSRVANSVHINYEPEHMKQFHNFPYIARIDIFVLDYLYKDEQQEKQRCEEVKHIIAVADSIIAGEIAQPVKRSQSDSAGREISQKH